MRKKLIKRCGSGTEIEDPNEVIDPKTRKDSNNNFGRKIGNFFKQNSGNMLSVGSTLMNSFLPETIDSGESLAVGGVLDTLSGVSPYFAAANLLYKGINYLGGTDLPTLKTNQDTMDTLARAGGGYDDFLSDWNEATSLSGKRVGFFSNASGMKKKMQQAQALMVLLLGILGQQKTNDLITALLLDRLNELTMMNFNGGPGNIMFGRLGLKVEILPRIHEILNTPKVVDTLSEFEEVQEFKEGGKMNVIPEGSLHARLHHMENAEGLTKKGIPVVSIAEGGELEQLAEIELNEIIFNLDVTTELEKLMEDGSDNAAIEAGKLLVKEIFENTDDRTGLIKLLEPEKKEPTTEDIVKNHQVFKNGGIIEKVNSLSPEQLEKLTKFLNEV